MESFEAMFNENVEVDVEVDENNISSNDVEEDELNDEPKRPNKRARNLSTVLNFLKKLVKHPDGKLRAQCKIVRKKHCG